MLFSELYSAYYNAVAAILKEALSAPVTDGKISGIAKKYAFGESFITITEALKDGRWPLLKEDRTAVVENDPKMPLTTLQKRWLKAISLDPRVRLFGARLPEFPDVEPLFTPEDVCVFDKYEDGDDYTDEDYITRFRLILDAAKNRYPLKFSIKNRKGRDAYITGQPEYVEYSEKDDKFRVIVAGAHRTATVNIGRIRSCVIADVRTPADPELPDVLYEKAVIEVKDERNALERVFLHFAHFEKEAERTGKDRYRITVKYDRDDEAEMVIRVLSFGPVVKVAAPERFRELIKARLLMQKNRK